MFLVFLHCFIIALIPSRHFTEMRSLFSKVTRLSKQEGSEGRREL